MSFSRFYNLYEEIRHVIVAKRSLRRSGLGIDYANCLKDCFRILQIDFSFIDPLDVLLHSQFQIQTTKMTEYIYLILNFNI